MLTNKLFFILYKHLFPEEYLLELLLKLHLGTIQRKYVIEQFKKKHRWNKIIDLMNFNQVNSMGYEAIEKNKLQSYIPYEFLQKLSKDYLLTQYIVNQQKEEYERVLKKLSFQKIEFLVMKTLLYDNKLLNNGLPKARNDLDILIPIHQFKCAAVTLLSLGYLYYRNHYDKTGKNRISSIEFYQPQSQEIFKKDEFSVELHSTIVDTFDFFADTINKTVNLQMTQLLYKDSAMVKVGRYPVKVFSPTSLFISLFLHSFIQHNFQSGASLYEAAAVIKKYKTRINWLRVEKLITQWKLEEYFIWYVVLLHDVFLSAYDPILYSFVNKFKLRFSVRHSILYYYTRYRVFHPSKFLLTGELHKEWTWVIISNGLLKYFLLKSREKFNRFIFLRQSH